MMDIFTTKESALVHLNSTRIAAGEIKVYRYYSTTGSTDSFVVIGLQDGIGPDCYQILSKRKNLIVNIDDELPDASRLIQGQIHVCPVNGVYHMVYVEDSQRIDREISDSEVYYVEDFDSGYMYYLDRYTCKKLDDYFSKVYIDLSNTNALYEVGKYPETTITVWKDNSDITSACQIGITTVGCNAIYDGSRTIRVTGMTERTAKVVIKVIYRGNTYQETWNIQKVQEGIKGADAEVWTVLSKNSFIREPDMQATTFQVLYQSGSELSYLGIPNLQNFGLRLTYEYSNGEVGLIDTQDFEFKPRILDDNTELTFCIIRLLNQGSEVLSALTLPYLPNISTISSGQGVYKSIVFCRLNEVPETPLGGSWDSPIPTTGQWSQEAPEGSEILWMSTRIFTTDSKTPQDSAWSTPSRLSNTESLSVMYSTCQDSTIVGTPSTNPENWEMIVTGVAYFMATRTIINGIPGLWQVFAIHGVDGDIGDYRNYIYFNSTTKPETPTGSHPEGWEDFPSTDGIWWMCVGLFSGRTNELIGTWSNPIKVTGIDGGAGQDAPYLIYQYAIGTSLTDAPTYNWSSSIPTVPKGMYLWQRSGTVTPPATAPTTWNIPIRITGEQGEQGAPGTAVTIDLTNEVSSVAADYEGNVVAAATFETTQVLLYNNSNPIDLESDRKVRSITIIPDGVQARVSRSGLVTIESWTAPKEQDTATVVINVNYNYNTYTAVYSIQKVKAGAPGKDAVLYSIIPSTNVLRKVNTTISPRRLTAQVRKAVGPDLSNITNLDSEGIELVYSINGNPDETYDFVEGIDTADVEYVTLTLKSKATGSVIDKETILTMESTIDLIVDLTNEVSAVAALENGELADYSNFEKSKVRIYYGSLPIDPGDCQIKASWSNMKGEFNSLTGVITPTGWDPDKLGEYTGQCTLEVTYKEFTKAVTYTVTKINSGETPVLYRLMPEASIVNISDSGISKPNLRCAVWQIVGRERTLINPEEFAEKNLKLVYKCIKNTEDSEETNDIEFNYSEPGVPMSDKIEEVTFYFYDITDPHNPLILDQETVPVLRDGTSAYAVVVDLTNENSCVAADFDGVVPEGAVFEPTRVLIYRNGNQLEVTDTSVGQIELDCSGVEAEIDVNGVITINSWTAPIEQQVATIEVTVPVDEIEYKCVYSIVKIKAGASGETPVLYSLLPSSNIIRKLNGKLSVDRLFVDILRTHGLDKSIVLPSQEDLVLKYTENYGNETEYTNSGISISDTTESIQIILRDSNGTTIDRETIIVVEAAIDLVVDLTNENSCVAADFEGNLYNTSFFETSTVQIHYGSRRIGFSDPDLQTEITWTGLKGTFANGLITPTEWTSVDDTASATVKVTYDKFVKTVTYSITRVRAGENGETPVLYSLMPSSSAIRKLNGKLSTNKLYVDVLKTQGLDRSIVTSLGNEGLVLKYIKNSGNEFDYTGSGITIDNDTEQVQVILRDSDNTIIDRETIVVIESAIDLVVDLTNEASAIAADYEGKLYDAGLFESSTVQVYYGSTLISFSELGRGGAEITWTGIQGTFENGVITPTKWTSTGDTASATVKITYGGFVKTVTYTITRVRAGESGETPIIYSLLPSANVIRKLNGRLSTNRLFTDILKTDGLDRSVVLPSNEGLVIKYIENSGSETDYTSTGVPITGDTEQVQFILKDSDGVVLDKETIVVIESEIDLVVDLTNENSCIAADSEGKIYDANLFETSTVQVYHGGEPVDFSDTKLRKEITWTGIQGTFENGVIKPTKWTNNDSDTASAVVKITYGDFTKTVTYSITRVRAGADGKTPVLYRLIPDASMIKVSAAGIPSRSYLKCTVWKVTGKERVLIDTNNLSAENLKLSYHRSTDVDISSNEVDMSDYTSSGVSIANNTETSGIIFYLYDITDPSAPFIVDQEAVPVLKDGTNGTDAYAVVVDLTNESSCVASDAEGNIPDGTTFEPTKLLIYRNGVLLRPVGDARVGKIRLDCNGVSAEVDDYGIIRVNSWTASSSQSVATVEVTVPVDGIEYKCIYSITKVRAGESGESPVIYSLLPSSNIIRKLNRKLSTNKIYVDILRTQGLDKTIVLPDQEGLVLTYTENYGNEIEYTNSGISILDSTEQVQIILRDSENTVIDKETIIVVETAIDLVVDLTNETSAITADSGGNIFDLSSFETSTVQIYYGHNRIDFSDPGLQTNITWTGVSGTFVNGVITPTEWITDDDVASATVRVTYEDYTKTVTYTITRVRAGESGETPVIWRIIPEVTSVKASATGMSRDSVSVDVYKISGTTRSIIIPDQFESERVRLSYISTLIASGPLPKKTYQNYIPITSDMSEVEVSLQDYDGNVLDKETIPVVYDGINAYNVVLDLTNENSSVIADREGNLIGTIEETEVKLYCNQEEIRLNSLTSSDITFEWFCLQGSWNASSGRLTNINWKSDEISKASNSGYVRINVTYQGITYSKVYTVTKVRQAEDGESPILYSVIPSVNSIKVSGDVVYTPRLTVGVNKHTVEGTTALSANSIQSEGLEIVYRVDNNPNYQVYSNYIEVHSYNIQIDVAIRRTGSDVLLDKETIPVVYDGADACAIVVDLTNENSSVAANSDGVVPVGAYFESTKLLIYRNGVLLRPTDPLINSINLVCNGVEAEINTYGVITVTSWTALSSQQSATIDVIVTIDGTEYRCVYSITKVSAGASGESPVIYSLLPSSDIIRKFNGSFSTNRLFVSILKTQGLDQSIVLPGQEGLALTYTKNGGYEEISYPESGIPISDDTEYIQIILKNSLGSVIDKETIIVVETAIDLVVDLTNEASAIAADSEGNILDPNLFETSIVQVYYGSERIDFSDSGLQADITWTGIQGTFSGGLITPTRWTATDDAASVTVKITYKEYIKTVTYTITRVRAGADGKTPVLYRLMPGASIVKASANSLSVSTLRCDVWEITGKTRSNLELADLANKKLSLVYRRLATNLDESDNTDIIYSSEGVRMSSKIEEVTFYLYDVTNSGKPQLLDQETVPVVKDGTNAYSVAVDLTNESSCVAANSEGVVPEGAYFESTKLLVYRNGAALKLDNPIIGRIELECSGVTAEIDKYGTITVKSWVAPASQSVANIEITVPVDGVDYKCIYSITKVNAGASGESPVIYSLMPSSNTIRKFNGNLSTNRLFVSILKTQGLSQSTVLSGQEGLVLRYTKNGGESEIAYTDSGIPISDDTEYIQILLKDASGTVIDRETIIVVETAVDLVVDLTNESSAITADPEGNILDPGAFETSTVQVYYGPERVDFSNPELQADITWAGIQGTFIGGLITPTCWTATGDTASAIVKVTYAEYVKTVTYTITRVRTGADGETPVIWRIVPDVTSIKATSTGVSRDSVAVDVYKITGASRSIVTSDQFRAERVKLVYARTFTASGTESEKTYQNYVPITAGMTKVEISLYDYEENVLDRESVPVVYDGIDAYNVVLDLTNENSNVIADKDGNLIGTIEETEVKLYCNQEEIRLSSLAPNSIVIEWFCLQGSWNVTTGKLTNIRWKDDENSKTSNSGYVRVNVTYQGITYSKVYTVTKIRQAEDGKSPVLYSVIPSVNSVKVSGNVVYTPQLTVGVNKHTVDGTTNLSKNSIASEGLEVVYRVDNNPNYQVYSDYIEVQPENIQFDVAVRRQGSDTFLDRETIPVVRDGSAGTKPNWKDYIFCMSETQPAAPTFTKHPANGAADNYGRVWMDGPAGEDGSTWWMSVATIYGESQTNELVSGTSWSEPVRVTGNDGTGYECEYTNSKNLVTPPESATWSKTPSTPPSRSYTWMRMRSTKDEAWSYMRITGERGSDGNSIIVKGDLVYVGNDTNKPLANSDTELMLIGDTTYVKGMDSYSGLIYQGPNARSVRSIANGDCFLYEGSFFICTGVSGDKNVFQVMSVQGDPGESWITYIAYSTNSQGTDKVEIWQPGYDHMGVAVVTYADHTEWSSVPAEAYRWAQFHGQDGIGQEFVFKRNDSTTTAPDFNCPTLDRNGKRITEDEYLPTGWTDDPQEVEDVDGHRVQWVSHRTKTNGSWGEFSPRVVWNRFAKDGTGINVKGTIDKIAKTQGTTNYILIPAAASDYTTGSTNIVGDLYLNHTKQTNVANGDTYLYNGFFIICSGRMGNFYSWNITAAKGDPGDPAFVHVLYADDESGTNETDTWSPGKGYIAIVSTNSEDYPDATIRRVWVKFQGQDGPGQEFIFIKTKTDTDRFSPSPETLEANQSDEYLPSDQVWHDWNDDPVDVDSEFRIQWVSQRVRDKNGVWGKFSKPTVWSRYAKDGTGINVKGVLQYVGSNTSDYQNYILTDSYTHRSSTSCHGKLYMGGTEVTSVANGDTYSYDGYFFICAGSTSGIYDWLVMKAKGDDGKSSYTFIRYSATPDASGTMSETWAAGMKYIGFATTDKNIVPDKGNFVWSEFLGRDGVGQEFIYCLSDTLTSNMSRVSQISPSADSSHSSNSKAFQQDEFLPGSSYSGDNPWTDDPQDVLEQTGKRRQWISSRVKRNGVWRQFSVPTLWTEKPGTAFNLTLGNQNLDAVFFGTGVVRPSAAHSGVESAIVNGNCAGTTVSYLKGDARINSTYTLTVSYEGQADTPEIVVYVYSNGAWQTFNNPGVHHINESISNFEIFVSCGNKSINQWTVTIESADHVSKTLTVTRTAFAPSISLGISSYAYNTSDDGTITYTPSKTTPIEITYLSNGKLTTLDAFGNYGYRVHARYVDPDGITTTNWTRITNSVTPTLESIVGAGNDPSSGSIEFEVSDAINNNQGSPQVFCRATISIVSSADLESVKTYLLGGNAAITGHLWAKDGKIGNWIINALDNSAGNISYNGTVIASYDSSYPVGSLRSSNGTIVFDPNDSSNGGIWLKYTNNNQDFIKCNGSGRLAQGNFTWDDNGNVSLTGSITSSFGSIAGWKISSTSIYNRGILNDGTERGSGIEINSTNKSVTTYNVITDQSVGFTPYFTYQGLSISPSGGLQIYESDNRNHWTPISYIRPDGSGLLANGNISWESDGSGQLAGWSFNNYQFEGGFEAPNGSVTSYKSVILDSSEQNLGVRVISGSRNPRGGSYTELSLSPTSGFLIQTGSDARSNLAMIDLEGNGEFGDRTIKWSSSGSGSLARGNFSWDTYGNISGPTIGTEKAWALNNDGSGYFANGNISWDSSGTISGPSVEMTDGITDNAWKFETNGDIKTYKRLIATKYSGDSTDQYITTIDPGLIYVDMIDDGDLYRTRLRGQDIYVYGMGTTSEYSRMMYDQIDVTDGSSTSTITPTGITASAFSQSSDERLKTKISDITLTSEQISEAPAIVYHWNTDDTKTRRAGTTAQYWQSILPEVVVEDPNGNLGLNYSELSTISVISLAKEIVELKARIKELENK